MYKEENLGNTAFGCRRPSSDIWKIAPEETAERDALRREYIDAYKRSLTAQLDNTYIQYPDGTRRKLEKKG